MKRIVLIALCAIALFSCKKDVLNPTYPHDATLIGTWIADTSGHPRSSQIDTIFVSSENYFQKSRYSMPKYWKTVSDTLCIFDGINKASAVVILRSLYKVTGTSLHLTELYAYSNMPIIYAQSWYHKK